MGNRESGIGSHWKLTESGRENIDNGQYAHSTNIDHGQDAHSTNIDHGQDAHNKNIDHGQDAHSTNIDRHGQDAHSTKLKSSPIYTKKILPISPSPDSLIKPLVIVT
ncbi:hypothetical protein BJP34_03015 [Moorena producens PAL-8-15-08-1]|uniref:Uncharacterized protein n=1 Tax=Moorena producens PAL-8-15-08-1 TaxID=1458985 RepID=A0A1D8TLV3_9CYAN|nr:hypothetical protein BJP34_03015 [Moorena producens PAL-8-15-08-1]